MDGITSTVTKIGFESLLKKLAEVAVKKGFESFTSEFTQIPHGKISLNGHLESTYARCSKTKTLINPDEPVELMSLYVGGNFETSKYTPSETVIDDFDMIKHIWDRKRIVLCGSAGTGKTFFTKYFWLAAPNAENGKIPIYVELRNINEITSGSLLTYIYATVVDNKAAPEARTKFDEAVKEGRFTFIFDGFDELKEEKRAAIEKEILELSAISAENVILVTSRPDERFRSWQSFWSYHVIPLNKKQAIELIEKIEFDATAKKKFLSRVKQDLFEKHPTFLSTPLLITIMMLTFKYFADVPDKIHVFYEQAFETLFLRHDALKESFKRKHLTDLPIDIFEKQFAVFCLLTYENQAYTFTETKILEYLRSSKKVTGIEFDEELFFKDPLNSVCMFQRDGIEIIFSHRSFQEFFTAKCLNQLDRARVEKLLPRYLARRSDNTVGMLYDMNQDLVEDCYIHKMFEKFEQKLLQLKIGNGIEDSCRIEGSKAKVVRQFNYRLDGKKGAKNERVSYALRFTESDEMESFQSAILRLLQIKLNSEENDFKELHDKDEASTKAAIKSGLFKKLETHFINNNSKEKSTRVEWIVYDSAWTVDSPISLALEKWFASGGYIQFRLLRAAKVLEACNDLRQKQKLRYESLSEILNLS